MLNKRLCILVYNKEHFLDELFFYVPQYLKYVDEINFFDDRSTDNSYNKIQAFISTAEFPEQCVTLTQFSENNGEVKSRNRILEATFGDFIFLLDGDDLVDPSFLSAVTNPVSKTIYSCGWQLKSPKDPGVTNNQVSGINYSIFGTEPLSINMSNCAFLNDINVPSFQGGNFGADTLFWLTIKQRKWMHVNVYGPKAYIDPQNSHDPKITFLLKRLKFIVALIKNFLIWKYIVYRRNCS